MLDKAGEVRMIQERCRSWACEDCRRSRGVAVRNRLLDKAAGFSKPVLFTFTVDRAAFESPEAAYDYVRGEKFLPRLMRRLGLPRWVSVLEFQEASGEGWPHWHFLVDAGACPGRWYNSEKRLAISSEQYRTIPRALRRGWGWIPHYIDFGEACRIVQEWGISRHIRFSTSAEQRAATSPVHAIRYICKYLIKGSKRGLPPWVLERSRVRFLAASKSVGRLVSPEDDQTPKGEVEDEERQVRAKSGPVVDRASRCGMCWVAIGLDDRHVVKRFRGYASGEMVGACPWLESWEDFKFTPGGLVSYDVPGFESWEGYWQWEDTCSDVVLQERLAAVVTARRVALMHEWEAA